MSTLAIAGNDQTDYVQDKSPRITLKSFDVTLVDPVDPVALGDTVIWDDPLWTGSVVSSEARTWRSADGDHRYVKLTATNADVLADGGHAPFDLSDTPDNATTFDWASLVLTYTLKDGITEVRGKARVYEPGLWPGMEIDVTSAADGLTAETFTIMGIDVSYPTEDGPQFDIDLGLGDFTTATTGGSDGGPLDPPTLDEHIGDIAGQECCDDGGGGGGGGGGTVFVPDDPNDPSLWTDCSPTQWADRFNRVEPSFWGTADNGMDWAGVLPHVSSTSTAEVNGSVGVLHTDVAFGGMGQHAVLPIPQSIPAGGMDIRWLASVPYDLSTFTTGANPWTVGNGVGFFIQKGSGGSLFAASYGGDRSNSLGYRLTIGLRMVNDSTGETWDAIVSTAGGGTPLLLPGSLFACHLHLSPTLGNCYFRAGSLATAGFVNTVTVIGDTAVDVGPYTDVELSGGATVSGIGSSAPDPYPVFTFEDLQMPGCIKNHPRPGQLVNEQVGVGDGATTIYGGNYEWRAILGVTLDGVAVNTPADWIENTPGFTIDFSGLYGPPALGVKVRITYEAA